MRSQAKVHETRSEQRDETLHRLRARYADGSKRPLTIVNVSPNGLMARVSEPIEPGTRFALDLPIAGSFSAEVRWSLGGRIGCLLDREIPRALYAATLLAMR